MKKILVAILLMIFVLMITGCGNSNSAEEQNRTDSQIADNTNQTNIEENGDISAGEAENILREYLISVNILKSDYVLESFEPVLGEFENGQIFRFEMRFKEDIDEVGGRLIGNYAITTDGTKIFWYNPADDEWVEQIIENVSTEGVADYPAAIMVKGTIYLLEGVPMIAEVDESVIIGYTESFTNTFPKNNGETNFNPELEMPYAQVEGGIAVFYQNEWYLATPFSNVNNNVSSPLEGVTMEVTKCSDISVTVKIVNDTEKYIQCGDAFYLEVQDEESGEWRKLDTIIDNAAFDAIAHIIQKDSPCEMVIDFEWLYGKLEPGRYHIVKTITDFRGSGDYTDYIYMAEFTVN